MIFVNNTACVFETNYIGPLLRTVMECLSPEVSQERPPYLYCIFCQERPLSGSIFDDKTPRTSASNILPVSVEELACICQSAKGSQSEWRFSRSVSLDLLILVRYKIYQSFASAKIS